MNRMRPARANWQRTIQLEGGIAMDTAALLLVIVGALNWGLISLFQFDLVAWIGGGQSGVISRIIYGIVALAGIWCITLLFRDRREALTE